MEGKTVILSVMILVLAIGQLQVDAKSCCPTTTARNIYNACRLTGASRDTCASLSGCKIVSDTCPTGYDKLTREHDGRAEYCKLGCVSSVCNVMSALQNSDASDIIVSKAVARCTNSCSVFCAKESADALQINVSSN